MRQAQLFGEKVERRIGACGLRSGLREVLAGAPQRLHMPRAGDDVGMILPPCETMFVTVSACA